MIPQRLPTVLLMALWSSCTFPSAVLAQSGPRWQSDWDVCVATTKVDAKSIFLLVTAPQWDAASRQFESKVVSEAKVAQAVDRAYASYRLELPFKPDKKSAALAGKHAGILEQVALYGHLGLPRVILMEPGGRIYGRTGPVGGAEDFLRSLTEWETARTTTSGAVRSDEECNRYVADATAARELKNPTRALEAAKNAVSANPRSPLAHFLCGLLSFELRKTEDARRSYFNALSLDSTGNPGNAPSTIWAAGSWYNLGIALAENKAEALFFLRENLRTDRHTDAASLRAAEQHQAADRPDLVLEEYCELLSRHGFATDLLQTYLDLEARMFGERR